MHLCLGARNGEKTPTNALVYLEVVVLRAELPDLVGLLEQLRLEVLGLLGFLLLGQLGTVKNLPFKIRALGKESLS